MLRQASASGICDCRIASRCSKYWQAKCLMPAQPADQLSAMRDVPGLEVDCSRSAYQALCLLALLHLALQVLQAAIISPACWQV